MIYLASVTDIDDIWPLIRHHVAAAMDASPSHTFSLASIYKMVRACDAFLFYNNDYSAVVIIAFAQRADCVVGDVLVLGGSAGFDWDIWQDTIADFAKSLGVYVLEAGGRKGLERKIKNAKHVYSVYRLDLDDATAKNNNDHSQHRALEEGAALPQTEPCKY